MMELFECDTRDEIGLFGPIWDRLASVQAQYVPSFTDLDQYFDDPAVETRLVGLRDGGEVTALAVFLVYDTSHRLWLGEKSVLRIPVRIASLYGSASLGTADPSLASALLKRVARDRSINLLTFTDVPQSDFFYRAATDRSWRGPSSVSQHRTTRRLAQLPRCMEDYWSELRPTTRKAGLRDLKMFDRLGPSYTVFTKPEEAAEFLSRAAKLSAITYQQQLGLGVEDTPRMRALFERLASEGRLRGYIAAVDGTDVAFIWGDISHRVFYFRTTGFDTAWARYSPGKAILFSVMRDLIDSRVARTFDFSGRDMEFKKRFSTSAIPCANFVMTRWSSPRGVATVALDRTFDLPKTLGPRLLGAERIERIERLRRAMRN